jgi:amino acid permease
MKLPQSVVRTAQSTVLAVRRSLVFLPGTLVVLTSGAVIFAPDLVALFIAAFFLITGMILWYVGYKFVQLKKRVEDMVRGFDGKVLIQGVNFKNELFEDYEEIIAEPSKKIQYH